MNEKAIEVIYDQLDLAGMRHAQIRRYRATAILDALKAARIAVVELPGAESSGHEDDGDFDWWAFPWGVTADSTGQVGDETGCELTAEDARGLAASWLAAADAAETGVA